MYQQITITGRLTREPKSDTYGENTVCRIGVAVDDGYGEKKTTDFFNVSIWGKRGKNVQDYLKKGSLVQVVGKMKSSKKDTTTYWELRADDVIFLDSKSSNSNNNNGGQYQQNQNFQNQNYQQNMQQNYQPQNFQQNQNFQNQNQFGNNGFFPNANDISDDNLPF
ncbi:single-stranded DNA-binding protein [Cytobacillus oceanisediminis]|uniref:single-stranded DNA-binding protein n=1 Tax=Cytobacillus oceanisediminis TaxID=665099 RepID=UPI001FB56181|nr:single-stranded DNA-binding protein [Cytobacillus oceanisediminis]UOE58171.1 single-stranded DNA-binding protein [Cytobacillus oceanisediminis]